MKRIYRYLSVAFATVVLCSCSDNSRYKYETVEGDQTHTRIYTLDNGLKVFLSRNDQQPRVMAYIAVRTGSKNDPAETTGLAHYLEHLMFKGTQRLGTSNYEAEAPLLEQIEEQYEVYRRTTDEGERKAIYHVIDSLSGEASHYGISNEYDKAISLMGGEGDNAYTTSDATCYMSNIPSNQVDNWLALQADRFQNMVIRGFHTELETVYEEYNMGLSNDIEKVWQACDALMYRSHPYGTQTTIGRGEHLKNPSITNIKQYFKRWYRPDNVAICIAGDIDFDQTIAAIDRHFGQWKAEGELEAPALPTEAPITQPRDTTVYGQEAEQVMLAWRFPGANTQNNDTLLLIDNVLANGRTGLVDINLNLSQKVIRATVFPNQQADYSSEVMIVTPKQGQTLEEARDLVLEQVKALRNGEFTDSMLTAIIANEKLQEQKAVADYETTASNLASTFVDNCSWEHHVGQIARMEKITRDELIAFANRYLRDDNYVCVYKRQGADPNEVKIAKPQITPIDLGTDRQSEYLKQITAAAASVQPIEPRFVDFATDMATDKVGQLPLLYKANTQNRLFNLTYIIERGYADDPTLEVAGSYYGLLGTTQRTATQLKQDLYALACDLTLTVGSDRTYISLSGLDENMEQALSIAEETLTSLQPNDEALEELKSDIAKKRMDLQTNQRACNRALSAYVLYGTRNPWTVSLPMQEVSGLTVQQLTDLLHGLCGYQHTVLYYGPRGQKDVAALVEAGHKVPAQLKPCSNATRFNAQLPDQPTVYLCNYDAPQTCISAYSVRDEHFDLQTAPWQMLFNAYFDGDMSSTVFQEMREARGLCYQAYASYEVPSKLDERGYFERYIGTQFDKMPEAMATFVDITENLTFSQESFDKVKDNFMSSLRTSRKNGYDVLLHYMACRKLGLDHDWNRDVYNTLQGATIEQLRDFHAKHIKGRAYNYAILGPVQQLDMDVLKSYGPVVTVKTGDIFPKQ